MAKYITADEYTELLREEARQIAQDEGVMRQEFFDKGGEITKCPPFTPGGLKRFDRGSRPERSLITTPEGIKVEIKGEDS